jgi:hypothetical protein
VKSFEATGMRKRGGGFGYDMDVILNKCSSYISPEIRNILVPGGPAMTELARHLRTNGELSESNFDAVNIPRQSTVRDLNRVTHQKRYCFLTHSEFMKNAQLRVDAAAQAETERLEEVEARKNRAVANKEAAAAKKVAAEAKRAEGARKKAEEVERKRQAAVARQLAADINTNDVASLPMDTGDMLI